MVAEAPADVRTDVEVEEEVKTGAGVEDGAVLAEAGARR